MFNDCMQVESGVCSWEDCAAVVMATVISTPSPDRIIIDGGSKTFATDVQPNCKLLYLKGFGRIVEYPEAIFERMNEEHGIITIRKGHNIKVGDTLQIIPNHICPTINMQDSVYLAGEDGVLEEIKVAARGKLL